jgi:hypothetical protein
LTAKVTEIIALPRGDERGFSLRLTHQTDEDACEWYVIVIVPCRVWSESVAKLFLRPKQATLIQEWMQPRNIDSRHRPVRFDYCAIAMQQRVLQHIRSNSGHWSALALNG